MLSVILLIALAQTTAPGIHIDEEGFVTLNEAPEVREQERRNMEMLHEAEQAFIQYRNDKEGDFPALIAMHEKILNSGMVLVPEVRNSINSRLAELHQRYADGAAAKERKRIKDLTQKIQAGERTQENADELVELLETEHRKEQMLRSLSYQEELLAGLPRDAHIEAARLLTDMAMTSGINTPLTPVDYWLRARQRALAVPENDSAKREADGLANVGMLNALSIMHQHGSAARCRELMETYKTDQVLVDRMEEIRVALEAAS